MVSDRVAWDANFHRRATDASHESGGPWPAFAPQVGLNDGLYRACHAREDG